jgi:hypothetical protein
LAGLQSKPLQSKPLMSHQQTTVEFALVAGGLPLVLAREVRSYVLVDTVCCVVCGAVALIHTAVGHFCKEHYVSYTPNHGKPYIWIGLPSGAVIREGVWEAAKTLRIADYKLYDVINKSLLRWNISDAGKHEVDQATAMRWLIREAHWSLDSLVK